MHTLMPVLNMVTTLPRTSTLAAGDNAATARMALAPSRTDA
jgi:hypothetical protein